MRHVGVAVAVAVAAAVVACKPECEPGERLLYDGGAICAVPCDDTGDDAGCPDGSVCAGTASSCASCKDLLLYCTEE